MSRQGNSPLIIIVVVFVIAIAAAGFYFLKGNSSQETSLPSKPSQNQESNRYIEYAKEGYEIIKNDKHVLFFYANWCPTCRPADAEFQARMSEIPEDLALVRVNYNDTATDADEEALANEYGITYQHTYVLLENGQEVMRWNGGAMDELLARVN